MLNLLVARASESLSKAQLGGWTGYSINSGHFSNALGELSGRGLIQRNGDQISVLHQPDAIQALGPDYTQNIDFSLEGWLPKLSKPAREFLSLMKEDPEKVFSKEELSEATGYSSNSGHFSNALGEICTKKLAVRMNGGVRINQELLR